MSTKNKVNEVGLRIKSIRNSLGINQSELSRRLKVRVQSVQQWENQPDPKKPDKKITKPKGENLKRLSKISGKSEAWILFGTELSTPYLRLFEIMEDLPECKREQVIEYADLLSTKIDKKTATKKVTKLAKNNS